MKKKITACLVLSTLFFFMGCDGGSPDPLYTSHQWSGETMGTYYRITVVEPLASPTIEQFTFDLTQTKPHIEMRLAEVTASMSTYDKQSELSRFNALTAPGCMVVSQGLLEVAQLAMEVAIASEGAFNPLVGPLVERWGFGSSGSEFILPQADEITALLARVDLTALSVDEPAKSLCKQSDMALDLSAIAKGYGVDQLSEQLYRAGARHFLVDIGGEVRVLGHNAYGKAWRLAIEKPILHTGTVGAIVPAVEKILSLNNVAIATSGDYRNFFEYQGRRYSHTIDARSGYPVRHALASVSVIADTAAIADAWATALNVMGPEQAMIVAQKQQLAVFLVTRENGLDAQANTLSTWHSSAFEPYLAD